MKEYKEFMTELWAAKYAAPLLKKAAQNVGFVKKVRSALRGVQRTPNAPQTIQRTRLFHGTNARASKAIDKDGERRVDLDSYQRKSSAEKRRVIFTSICFSVEVSHFSTIGDQIADRIQSIGFDNSGEGSHLTVGTRMPDHTLHESLATNSREEVNLSGRGLKLHWCPLLMNLL
jgi:hypothetical protein